MASTSTNVGWRCSVVLIVILIHGCAVSPSWHLVLHHDRDGQAQFGSVERLISTIRQGCQLRVAWGTRRAADPARTIEHAAEPIWVSVRDGQIVEVQLDQFLINLSVFGEAPEEHPRRQRFGGTEQAVSWRANLKTDGTFDAVWYSAATGTFITRAPQRHPMKWFADCPPSSARPLFAPAN